MSLVAQVTEDRLVGGFTRQEFRPDAPVHETTAVDAADLAAGGIAAALRSRIGEQRFDLWFDRKTRLVMAGNTLMVEVANAFAARWISEKFRGDLMDSARRVLGHEVEISIRISAEVAPPRSAIPGSNSAPKQASRQNVTIPNQVSLKYALEEFVVGPSNQLAYHAALRVAENPGKEFNPLFLHGHCGLGKTHLLQGICQRFARMHPGKNWLYLTGEQFTNEFVEAIHTHKTAAFRRRLRGADLLVLDDVHFLGNKKATQEEFLHTFNQIDGTGRQIVLASDCAPRDIQALSQQLSSRFVSGMVLRVDSPDLPTRLEILRRRVAKNGWQISDAVLMHIARTAAGSVRELEGMLLQVLAGVKLINSGGAEAAHVLADLRQRSAARGPIPIERIVAAVAEHFAILPEAITGRGREKLVSAARAVAMHLAREHTGMSFPEIARAMGGKNHSTVIAACQRVEGMIGKGELLSWQTPAGPRNQAISDILHDLDATVRRAK